ncbi:MAG: hypothetical protein BZY87_10270 [SAR202 cluster bacterium Io17-Chloro-G6]|nr:MAG: hypothetical protein BZY87_10270 [SAR202 cluster bacterium Io17-Chloro-G6]
MVKVSISLPNNTQITFESDEAEVLREIVAMALRELPRDLMQSPASSEDQLGDESEEKSTDRAGATLSAVAATPEPEPGTAPVIESPAAEQTAGTAAPDREQDSSPAIESPAIEPAPAAARSARQEPSTQDDSGEGEGQAPAAMPSEFVSEEGRKGFVAFCQESNPLGDMRRVVVAAEGASRHFGADGVNSDDLGWLFDMAGWRRPGDFTQTLRNAARSKFGWLERIPGRSGRYAATPLGLSKTLSSN